LNWGILLFNTLDFQGLLGNHEGRRPLVRHWRRSEDNIKVDLQEVGWGTDWSDLAQDRGQVAGSCECGNEPSGFIKCGEFADRLTTF
jgi:hypothetical protein